MIVLQILIELNLDGFEVIRKLSFLHKDVVHKIYFLMKQSRYYAL